MLFNALIGFGYHQCGLGLSKRGKFTLELLITCTKRCDTTFVVIVKILFPEPDPCCLIWRRLG